MTRFALPALFVCIFALFFYSVASQSEDAPPDLVELNAAPQKLTEAKAAAAESEPSSIKAINGVGAELQRLSDEVRANSDKIAQTATLRSDLLKMIQDSKSSSDNFAKNMLDQINAVRSEQAKSLKDAKDTDDKAAQALRDEVAASQSKLAVQIDDAFKTNTVRSETLEQRVELMKKDIENVKKNIEEDRQSQSNLSPGIALLVALAALALGPFLAYQLTANQLAGIRQHGAATAAHIQTAASADMGPPLAPSSATEPEQDTSLNPEAEMPLDHEAPTRQEQADAFEDANVHPHVPSDKERV